MILSLRHAAAIGAIALAMALVPWLAAALVAALSLASLALRHAAPQAAAATAEADAEADAAEASPPAGQPVFSVHVPIHAEPPAVVLRTLAALAAQDWPAFEVVVIDNNTADAALWQPVRDWCRGRPGFVFEHRMGVRNAKAGALDIALALTAEAASHIVLVDADYVTVPCFLRRAAEILAQHPGAAAVQFPQAYRDDDNAPGVAADLRRFFAAEAPAADRAGAMLLTGTLSVIARDALQGGWATRSITEDAEMGVLLIARGGRILWCDEVMGRGLMPLTRPSLAAQRIRWAVGNLQVARRMAALLPDARPALRRALLRQLLCWHGWLLAPACGLIAAVIARSETLSLVSAGAIALEALVVVARAWAQPRPLEATAASWCMAWIGSLASIEAACARMCFERTDKDVSRALSPGARMARTDMLFLVAALLLALAAAAAGLPAAAAGALLLASVVPAAHHVDAELAAAAAAIQRPRGQESPWTSLSSSRR